MNVYIEKTNIFSAHGLGLEETFNSMEGGKFCFEPLDTNLWPDKVKKAMAGAGVEAGGASLGLKGTDFEKSRFGLRQIIDGLSEGLQVSIKNSELGVVLASTKYYHEDYIWEAGDADPQQEISKLTTWLSQELGGAPVHFISNACTSGVVGLKFAKTLLEKDKYEKVLVLSYDLIGPFVYSGFLSLGAISQKNSRPFRQDRDGLHLGEAFAGVLLSKEGDVCLKEAEFLNDGASTIRPTYAVEILPKLYGKMNLGLGLNLDSVDGILAHGTGTKYNDSAEISVIKNQFSKDIKKPFVTASKWSLGHSLGASALVDVCLADQILKKQRSFGVSTSAKNLEEACEGVVLTESTKVECKSILTQSLGFGGITGCTFLELR